MTAEVSEIFAAQPPSLEGAAEGEVVWLWARSPVAQAFLAADGRVLRGNLAWHALFGSERVGYAWRASFEPESLLQFDEAWASVAWPSEAPRWRIRDRQGRGLEVQFWVGPREPSGARAVGVTPRDEASRRDGPDARVDVAMQQQRLESLTILAGGIAHDFNNLLTAMLGSVQLGLGDPEVSALQRDRLDDIGRAAQQAARLTREMLVFAGRARFEPERVSVGEVASEMAALLRPVVPSRVRLGVTVEARDTVVLGERGALGQLVINLVSNAFEASVEGEGVVEVRVLRATVDADAFANSLGADGVAPGAFVVLTVRDAGLGMGPEVLARACEPFFTTRFSGRGLGLATVLGVVRAMGGRLRIESAPGEGTLVTVLLPSAQGEAVRAKTPQGPIPVAPSRVLVVDDDPRVRSMVMALLTRRNFEVTAVSCGAEALAILDAAIRFDVVLADLTMPVMSGEELGQAVFARAPGLPLVLMSGYDREDVAPRVARVPGADFVQKPFSGDALARVLRQQISNAQPRAREPDDR
ncbi:MAG: response regulator [Myxococcales bacterium]|nr:response regulator [Myxococcales bacterium]